MAVKPIPEGFHTVTPYFIVDDAKKFIDFMKKAFSAKELACLTNKDGGVMHAQMQIGDSMIMLGEATKGGEGQQEWHSMPGSFYLYVKDADALYHQAIKAGATSVMEPADHFYGDRHGGVKDEFGNFWWIATHIEDVPLEEIERRAEKFYNERMKKSR